MTCYSQPITRRFDACLSDRCHQLFSHLVVAAGACQENNGLDSLAQHGNQGQPEHVRVLEVGALLFGLTHALLKTR